MLDQWTRFQRRRALDRTTGEEAALFDSTYNREIPWELLIRMALCTGMRRGELLNLTWRDINFERVCVDVSPKQDTKET